MPPSPLSQKRSQRKKALLYALFVVVTSFFTYFYRYDVPPNPFWDEPYHIASAEKYISGVYFMEQHPPLGKLLIALGEKIVNANAKDDAFVTTDYARDFPPGFSFAGYRLFPTLLAWLTAPLLFFVFFFCTREGSSAAILSFLYVFDNAEIVHGRGAMLDSTLGFFAVATLLVFLYLQDRTRRGMGTWITLSALFGVLFACAMTTKIVALILVLLIPALFIRLAPDWRKISTFIIASALGFTAVYVGVWQLHFALGSRVETTGLPDGGYYQASPEYKKILTDHANRSLKNFPVMLRDSIRFIPHYNRGVPRLDLCKAEENGSPSYVWPFGGRTIDYRWEKTNDNRTRYLFLVANPIGWSLGLLGVILTVILLGSALLGERKEKIIHLFPMLTVFALYVGYMIAISRISRVMYLYHYFLPLLFSYILFCLAFLNIRRIGRFELTESRRSILLTILGLLVFASFQFMRPLTYYEPISDAALARRALTPLWELSCAGCDRGSTLVVPK